MVASSAASIALSALLFACEQPGHAEQQKEMQATDQVANTSQQTQNAQAEANKEIVSARTDFAKTREDYLHEKRMDLLSLDQRVFDLETKAQTATGKARADLTAHLPGIRTERDEFARHMDALNNETAATWDASKANLDKEWDGLKSAVDNAD
jgi:hypothetical protein